MKLRPLSSLTPLFLGLFCVGLLSGCAVMAASGDINDGSIEKTKAQDNEERMRRMRESGTLRPEEYDAVQAKMGGTRNTQSTGSQPSIEELEKRVEERRAAQQANQ